jgi:hypothetical protein
MRRRDSVGLVGDCPWPAPPARGYPPLRRVPGVLPPEAGDFARVASMRWVIICVAPGRWVGRGWGGEAGESVECRYYHGPIGKAKPATLAGNW